MIQPLQPLVSRLLVRAQSRFQILRQVEVDLFGLLHLIDERHEILILMDDPRIGVDTESLIERQSHLCFKVLQRHVQLQDRIGQLLDFLLAQIDDLAIGQAVIRLVRRDLSDHLLQIVDIDFISAEGHIQKPRLVVDFDGDFRRPDRLVKQVLDSRGREYFAVRSEFLKAFIKE